MNKWFKAFVFSSILGLLLMVNIGIITVYEPATESIKVTVKEIETGNHLIEMSEVNIILIIMMVGVLIVVR